jgi:hypothetical protein
MIETVKSSCLNISDYRFDPGYMRHIHMDPHFIDWQGGVCSKRNIAVRRKYEIRLYARGEEFASHGRVRSSHYVQTRKAESQYRLLNGPACMLRHRPRPEYRAENYTYTPHSLEIV